jgi:hypothetical protein
VCYIHFVQKRGVYAGVIYWGIIKMKICYDCMEVAKYLVHDKGTHVCQVCFHRRYSKRKWTNNNYQYKKYTLKDLKKHLEKDWD